MTPTRITTYLVLHLNICIAKLFGVKNNDVSDPELPEGFRNLEDFYADDDASAMLYGDDHPSDSEGDDAEGDDAEGSGRLNPESPSSPADRLTMRDVFKRLSLNQNMPVEFVRRHLGVRGASFAWKELTRILVRRNLFSFMKKFPGIKLTFPTIPDPENSGDHNWNRLGDSIQEALDTGRAWEFPVEKVLSDMAYQKYLDERYKTEADASLGPFIRALNQNVQAAVTYPTGVSPDEWKAVGRGLSFPVVRRILELANEKNEPEVSRVLLTAVAKHLTDLKTVDEYPDFPWNYEYLSKNANLTLAYVLANLAKPWNWDSLSEHPNIFIVTDVRSNADLPWNPLFLLSNPNFFYTNRHVFAATVIQSRFRAWRVRMKVTYNPKSPLCMYYLRRDFERINQELV